MNVLIGILFMKTKKKYMNKYICITRYFVESKDFGVSLHGGIERELPLAC